MGRWSIVRRRWTQGAIVGCSLITTACVTPPTSLTLPSVALNTVSIEDSNPVDTVVDIVINVHNNDPSTLRLRAIDYRLTMNARTMASGRVVDDIDIPPKATAVIGLPAVIRSADLIAQISATAGRRGIVYALTGTLEMDVGEPGRLTMPFQSAGALFLPTLPPGVFVITARPCGSGADAASPSRHRDREDRDGCRHNG